MRVFSSLSVFFLLLLSVLLCFAVTDISAQAAGDRDGSYYQLLQVKPDTDFGTIKKSYRKLSLLHHPDKQKADATEAEKNMFVKLAQAYEVLSDPRLRIRYDFLLSKGLLEYDPQATNWDEFDRSRGLPPLKKKSKEEQEAEFRFKDAHEQFKKIQEEKEEFALWTAIILAFLVALLPTVWHFWSKKQEEQEIKQKKKAAASNLKEQQELLAEFQKTQEEEERLRREEEREYQKQLKEERERVWKEQQADYQRRKAAGLLTEEELQQEADEEEERKQKKNKKQHKQHHDEDDEDNEQAEDNKDEEEEEDDKPKGNVYKCDLCKKKFKSEQQWENHEQSNQHKKALKDAAGGKRKSRRDD